MSTLRADLCQADVDYELACARDARKNAAEASEPRWKGHFEKMAEHCESEAKRYSAELRRRGTTS